MAKFRECYIACEMSAIADPRGSLLAIGGIPADAESPIDVTSDVYKFGDRSIRRGPNRPEPAPDFGVSLAHISGVRDRSKPMRQAAGVIARSTSHAAHRDQEWRCAPLADCPSPRFHVRKEKFLIRLD